MGGLQACALTTRHREAGTLRSRAPRLKDDGARLSSSGKAVAARMLACRSLSRHGLCAVMCGILMLEQRTQAIHAAQRVARTP